MPMTLHIQGIKDMIEWTEERIEQCKKHIKIIEDAKVQHPEHIKLNQYYNKRLQEELEHHKETLQHLKKLQKKFTE